MKNTQEKRPITDAFLAPPSQKGHAWGAFSGKETACPGF
ncbi:hypothetical protein CES86_2824 [Brucella lupini]|uniref:Uncharacterized protein n=1 Tax=Brucella lupini TaxID=255457 RepID=A0A256GNU4_9HYPH|nr:hypothetical protein CES86_2824 [Brucella lupini]